MAKGNNHHGKNLAPAPWMKAGQFKQKVKADKARAERPAPEPTPRRLEFIAMVRSYYEIPTGQRTFVRKTAESWMENPLWHMFTDHPDYRKEEKPKPQQTVST